MGSLAVETRDGKVWSEDAKGFPRIFAIGDCNYGCVPTPGKSMDEWAIPPIPKISYPGEEEGIVACTNIDHIDKLLYRNCTTDFFGNKLEVKDMHWPWGQVCSRRRWALMMHALWLARTGRRTQDSCA